jgi:hypothetical protein
MMQCGSEAGEQRVRTRRSQTDEAGAEEPLTEAATGYTAPFGWWGYHWTPTEPRSLVWLVQHGALDARIAAFLSLAMEARASLVVVAEPHEAGKTTLLTALIEFLPDTTQPVYLRGWYERFSFLDDFPPEVAYLLCNEISSHLPTYLWGHGVRRLFKLAAELGYPLATTMHATSAVDVFDQLLSYPLNVSPQHLSAVDLIVTIGVGYANNRLLRRITRVEQIRDGDEVPRALTLAHREPLRGEMTYQLGQLIGALSNWFGCDDAAAAARLARRARELAAWGAAGLVTPGDVRAAIARSRDADT